MAYAAISSYCGRPLLFNLCFLRLVDFFSGPGLAFRKRLSLVVSILHPGYPLASAGRPQILVLLGLKGIVSRI